MRSAGNNRQQDGCYMLKKGVLLVYDDGESERAGSGPSASPKRRAHKTFGRLFTRKV